MLPEMSSSARNTTAVPTAHSGCGISANATGTTSGTSVRSAPKAAANTAANSQSTFQPSFIVQPSLHQLLFASMVGPAGFTIDVDQSPVQLLVWFTVC